MTGSDDDAGPFGGIAHGGTERFEEFAPDAVVIGRQVDAEGAAGGEVDQQVLAESQSAILALVPNAVMRKQARECK